MTISEFVQAHRIRYLEERELHQAPSLVCGDGLVLRIHEKEPRRSDGPWVAFVAVVEGGAVPASWREKFGAQGRAILGASELVALLHAAGWPRELGSSTRKRRDNDEEGR